MELKLNQKKFIEDLLSRLTANEPARVAIEYALQEQGMRFYNGAVVPIMNPTFDSEHNTENKNAKFKVGDWIIGRATENEPRQIAEVTEEGYKSTYGGWYGFSFEEDMHLWTIQDAKDGDVLYSPTHRLVWIYKEDEHYHACINLNYADVVTFDNEIVVPSDVCPANMVQKSILFQKMEESNYKWNADKKELKKIEQKPNFCHHEIDFSGCSEEYRKAYYDGWNNCNQQHAQLEAEQKPAWSEEDEKMFEHIIAKATLHFSSINYLDEEEINFLKSLKSRVQPKQEWSEEDERNLNTIINVFYGGTHLAYEEELNWLKSLKDRYTWKPSDEQMAALSGINLTGVITYSAGQGQELINLYNDLKKLREL